MHLLSQVYWGRMENCHKHAEFRALMPCSGDPGIFQFFGTFACLGLRPNVLAKPEVRSTWFFRDLIAGGHEGSPLT